jgi:hypothetical protein
MSDRTNDAHPRRAAWRASGAALAVAAAWALLGGPFGVTVGLVVVAAFGGWLIGTSARPWRWIAVAAAVAAWFVALVAIYLYSLAAIPALPGAAGSGTDLGERIRETSIVAFYAQSFGILDAIQGAVLIGTAWWSSR